MFKKGLLYFFFLIIFVGCRKDIGYVNKGNFPGEIDKIFTGKCATSGCHDSKSFKAAGGLDLSSWNALFNGSSNGSPVVPFNTRFSSLCYYINVYPEFGIQNKPTMPLNKEPLSKEEVASVYNWIENGAPDTEGNIAFSGSGRKKLYAVNQGCDVVTVFDADTHLPMRYIDVGTKPGTIDVPHQVRVSPDGKFWYVIFINNNIMQKFSCANDQWVANIPLSPAAAGTGSSDAFDWNTFTISNDGKKAYAVSWTASGKVAAVDLEKHKLIHFLGGFNNPHAICLNSSNTALYVGAQVGNYITEIDTAFTNANDLSLENGQPVKTFSSLDIHDIIIGANTDQLLITCQKSSEVRVYSISQNQVSSIITTAAYPQEIIYDDKLNNYYVSCTYDSLMFPGKTGVITKLNGTNFSTSFLACGFQPHGIAINESKKMLYVLSRNVQSNGPAPHHSSQCAGRNGFVNFIDLNSFTVTSRKYELSVDPYFIFARP